MYVACAQVPVGPLPKNRNFHSPQFRVKTVFLFQINDLTWSVEFCERLVLVCVTSCQIMVLIWSHDLIKPQLSEGISLKQVLFGHINAGIDFE